VEGVHRKQLLSGLVGKLNLTQVADDGQLPFFTLVSGS